MVMSLQSLRRCVHLTYRSSTDCCWWSFTGELVFTRDKTSVKQMNFQQTRFYFCFTGVNVIFIFGFPRPLSQHNSCHSWWWIVNTEVTSVQTRRSCLSSAQQASCRSTHLTDWSRIISGNTCAVCCYIFKSRWNENWHSNTFSLHSRWYYSSSCKQKKLNYLRLFIFLYQNLLKSDPVLFL